MENNERVSGEETNQNNIKAGAFKPNPTRYNRNGSGFDSARDAGEGDEEGANFDQENNEPEINPGQLDREEVDLDRTGPDNSPSKQDLNASAQTDNQQGGDRGLSEGSNNRGSSGGAGGAQFGQGANTPGRSNIDNQAQRNGVGGGNDSKVEKKGQENLLGQGGYGTSGTSGTNSGGKQGYQSGLGSAGSQNGSTGYNAGSLGTKPDVNKGVDINHRP